MIQISSLNHPSSKALEDIPPMQPADMLQGQIKHGSISVFRFVAEHIQHFILHCSEKGAFHKKVTAKEA